ncbi:endoplasmic reticulum aminopeptidase 1-like, partial [Pseudomyrmex gracilis]|uniref:endoplasmic reticulum aminopeptidase 1-like n=1 Tax=Pseudomyrmex gracilis TaxID=219809 RepID=UPI000995288A
MADLRLLLSVLIFTAGTTFSVAEDSENVTYSYRLPDDVIPVHYNIKLISRIEEGNFTFEGESTIVVKTLRTTRTLSLHALDLSIDKAATTLISSNGNNYTPKHHIYDTLTSILAIRFDTELPPDIYHLNLKFVGVLDDNFNGFYRSSYTILMTWSRRWLAGTNFHPTSARRAFPCWDEPALKATFNISIKHNRNYTALSNMPMQKQTDDGNEDGMIWTHFETTPIISTYLIAFVVSDFVRCSDANDTITMWCSPDFEPQEIAKRTMQEVAAKAGQILTTYTNSSNKISKWDHVWIPFLLHFKREAHVTTLGLTTYSFNFWPIYEGPMFLAKYVTNAMAQQWIGCVVSPLWWTEKWLNDGL